MRKILVILGPTATGKTGLALSLAKKYNGELVACDSRQVYKYLDIGTGKLPNQNPDTKYQRFENYWEIEGIKVWMYDLASPEVRLTVKDYTEKAEKVTEDILKQGKMPIIVGGTGLYLRALLDGLPNLDITLDEDLRGELEKLPLKDLQEKLKSLSPTRWQHLNDSDKKNLRRLIRHIEIVTMNPYNITDDNKKSLSRKYDILKIGLTAPRQVLYEKIDSRVLDWIRQGIDGEVVWLMAEGLDPERFKELGLEYGVIFKFLRGEMKKEEMVEKVKAKVRQYAKRQLTWFKKVDNVFWFDITNRNYHGKVVKKVDFWYYAGI